MSKILSIIVPSFNMERYLPKCLGSLVLVDAKELQAELEVVVVNDGSRDSTLEIARSFEKKLPQVFKVIDKPNGNYGSCINAGLKIATGKYVKVLDADDSYDEVQLGPFLAFLNATDADVVFSGFDYEDQDGKVFRRFEISQRMGEKGLISDLPDDFISSVQMQAVAYKRDVFDAIQYRQTEGISYTDQEWMLYPMVACKNYGCFRHSLYRYLVGRDGQTIDPGVFAKNLWMLNRIVNRMLDNLEELKQRSRLAGTVRYLEVRTRFELEMLYLNALASSERCSCLNDVKNLDVRLATSFPVLYEQTGRFVSQNPLRFPYVKYWRMSTSYGCLMLSLYRNVVKAKRTLQGFLMNAIHFLRRA